MIRLSKLTDYAIVIMSNMAAQHDLSAEASVTAKQLSAQTHLPLPTVSKVLKKLAKAELLVSFRGVRGGYQIARSPHQVSVIQMIDAIEGPVALTECALGSSSCWIQSHCTARVAWQKINKTVRNSLTSLTLADMVFKEVVATENSAKSPSLNLAQELAQRGGV